MGEPTMRNAAGLLLLLLQHLLLCLSLPTPQDAEGHDNQNKDTDFCIRTDKGFLEHAKRQFTQSMEKFTQSIYLHAAEKNPNSNFVFSPLSIHSALTMLYLGTTSNSTTETELKNAMGGLARKEVVECSYKHIVDIYSQEWLVPFDDVNYDDTPLTGNFETPTGSKEVGMIQQINSNATYGEIKIYSDELVEVVSLPYK